MYLIYKYFLLLLYMNTLFNNLIDNLVDTKNKDLGDPNLKQGKRFDFIQNQIITQTTPKLHLMEQTTGDGLGSIIEPMTGSEAGSNPQVELEKLQRLEGVYEQLINKLITLNKHIDEPSVYSNSTQGQDTSDINKYYITKKGAACPKDYSILNDTGKCLGFFKNIQENPGVQYLGEPITKANQNFNPAPVNQEANKLLIGKPHGCIILDDVIIDTPKYSCTADYGKRTNMGDSVCPIKGQVCTSKEENFLGSDWGWCGSTAGATFNTRGKQDITKDPNSSLVCVENIKDELFSQVEVINVEVGIVADELAQQINILNTLHKKNNQNINVHRGDFSNNLNGLIQKKKELDALLQGSNNMRGQLQETRIEMKSSYIEYVTWFICAVTIGGVALSKLSR